MPWVETESPHFAARHELDDEDAVVDVLSLLEATWARLDEALDGRLPETPLDVVVHGSEASLLAAQPGLLVVRRLAAPAARRYLAGWPSGRAGRPRRCWARCAGGTRCPSRSRAA